MPWWSRTKPAAPDLKSVSPTVAAEVVRTGQPSGYRSMRRDGCIAYETAATEGFSKNAIAYRAIDEGAAAFSSVPWLLQQISPNGKPKEITDPGNPITRLLKRPNPFQSWNRLLYEAYCYLHVAGKCYFEALRPSPTKPPLQIYAHCPPMIQTVHGKAGEIVGYALVVNGQPKRIPEWDVDSVSGRSNMLYYHFFNPLNPSEGLSPIEAAAMGLDIHNAGNLWNGQLLQNGASSDFAIVTAQKVDDTNKSRWRDRWRTRHQGARNAGGFMIIDNVLGEFRLEKISFNPRDMSWIESKHTSAHEVALVLGGTAMPFMLGLPGMNTYANQEQARLAFYDTKILPMLAAFMREVENWLLPMFGIRDGQYCFAPDLDQVTALEPRRESLWKRVNESTFLTLNEKREAVGYEPRPDGDVYDAKPAGNVENMQPPKPPKPPVKANDIAAVNGVTVH